MESFFILKFFGLEDKQQSRPPVTREIAGPAPARTVIFGVFVHRLRLQTVNLRRQVRFLHTPLPTIRADNKILTIGFDDREYQKIELRSL